MSQWNRIGSLAVSYLIAVCMIGCEDRKPESTPPQNQAEAAAEAQKKTASIQFITLQFKELSARIETTQSRSASLGNKTRKKMKLTLDEIDARKKELEEGINRLASLSEAEFDPMLAKLNASLDSTSALVNGLKKHFK